MRIQVKQLRRHAAAHSFYHLDQSAITGCACAGLACFAARADRPRVWQRAIDQQPTVSCLGKCYGGPSDGAHDFRPNIGSHGRRTVLLSNVLIGGVRDMTVYREHGGGLALAKAQATAPGSYAGNAPRSAASAADAANA